LLPLLFGNNFVLSDESGQQFVNTLRPYGTPLAVQGNLAAQRKVYETRAPVISDVFFGQTTKSPGVLINVPIFRGNDIRYVLSVGILPDNLTKLLVLQKLPPGWITAIFDSSGVIAGRSQASERYAGLKGAAAPLAAMAKFNEGSIETITKDGVPVFAAFSRSEISHWVISIGVPVAALSGSLNTLLLIGSVCALALLAIGLVLAAFQSNQIARAVQDLIPPALALGRGETPTIPRLHVSEANDVAKAINRAHRLLQDRTAERDDAKVKEAAAETAAGVMDEFVATVSHELRTPLTSIAASLGLLAGGTGGALPAPALRLITIAHVNTQRLVRLVNDILDIGKIDSGNMTFHLAPVDLRATAADAIEASRALAQTHGTSIRLDAGPASCMVRADADRLTQVVANLFSNAIKFSPVAGEVTVTVGRHAGMGRIAVHDLGPGIPEEFKPRIFEKFTQADNSDTRQKGGTGLGLNIVQKIVSQHGGNIGFDAAPGGGTIFTVDIPLWSEAVKAA